MHRHHHGCEHEHMNYCKTCGMAYCSDCGKEWRDYNLQSIPYLGAYGSISTSNHKH